MQEIEAKYRVAAPDVFAQRCAALPATRRGHVREDNRLFDTPAADLRAAGCGLRIRTATDETGAIRTTCTYKGPRDATADHIKAREEFEVAVDDAGTLAQLLGRLGYTLRLRFEKERTTWTWGDCTITLDVLPELGCFCEIEAPDAAAIEACAAQLGLTTADAVHETYVALAAQHGHPTPDGCIVLRFADPTPDTR